MTTFNDGLAEVCKLLKNTIIPNELFEDANKVGNFIFKSLLCNRDGLVSDKTVEIWIPDNFTTTKAFQIIVSITTWSKKIHKRFRDMLEKVIKFQLTPNGYNLKYRGSDNDFSHKILATNVVRPDKRFYLIIVPIFGCEDLNLSKLDLANKLINDNDNFANAIILLAAIFAANELGELSKFMILSNFDRFLMERKIDENDETAFILLELLNYLRTLSFYDDWLKQELKEYAAILNNFKLNDEFSDEAKQLFNIKNSI